MLRTIFLIALFLLPNFALAQTFNVSTTAQLRTAFENASVNGEDDTIILAAGTYKTTDDGIGTFKFSDTEAHNLTIKAKDGLTANDVILDGANTHQVLNLTSTKTATFTIDRITIRNGKTSSSSGGGIYANNILTVTDSTISGNTASYGGGIRCHKDYTVTVINSTISGNTASSGGGINGYGTFINNIFDNNSSDIYFQGNSNIYNNYIDYTKLQNEASYTIIKKNNIQPSSGSLNFADSSLRLGSGSVAIDKGLDPNSTTFTGLFTGNTTTLQTVQTALQTDKDGNTRIIGSAIDLGAYEYNGSSSTANNCAATLSSDLKLHIPILTFNGQSYWADLQHTSGSNFTLSNAGAVTDTSSYSSCTPATLSSDYKLHISVLTYNNVSYWADFQYSTTEAIFTLTGAAAN